jgi:hypothetical protein
MNNDLSAANFRPENFCVHFITEQKIADFCFFFLAFGVGIHIFRQVFPPFVFRGTSFCGGAVGLSLHFFSVCAVGFSVSFKTSGDASVADFFVNFQYGIFCAECRGTDRTIFNVHGVFAKAKGKRSALISAWI